jgi:hypothetical protein
MIVGHSSLQRHATVDRAHDTITKLLVQDCFQAKSIDCDQFVHSVHLTPEKVTRQRLKSKVHHLLGAGKQINYRSDLARNPGRLESECESSIASIASLLLD